MEPQLLIPSNDTIQPELSIVVPALNEEITIAQFIDWCHEGLQKANIKGEILIVDSSTDKTAEIAVSKGARVLKTPKRGLGRAYIDSIPYIRGKYIIMGDCDCTYDFRELLPFVKDFHNGAEYIMGSRFKGYIEPGAMPPLHQYFGTPITTWILNTIYRSRFTDIHCGMRGVTLDALKKINLQSQGWEYASELVLKSVHLNLKTTEVPIRFYKDQEGRLSHHKRSGWLSPWIAGWINLKAMFIYGANFFLYKPGFVLLSLGLLLMLPLLFGPLTLGPITFSLFWMMLGLVLSVVGLQSIYMGIFSQSVLDFNHKQLSKWVSVFSYNRTVWLSLLAFFLGLLFNVPLVCTYIQHEYMLTSIAQKESFYSIFGLFLMIVGFMTFTFILVLHALEKMKESRLESGLKGSSR